MNVQIILSQMLMLFVMMLIGYFLWKKQWLDEPANQKLSKIVGPSALRSVPTAKAP